MPTYADVFSKTEQAAAAYLATKSIGTDSILNGQNNTDKPLPCVVLEASGPGEFDETLQGNVWVNLQIMVRYLGAVDVGEAAADVKAANDALVKATFDAMLADDITTQLSAFADFTCQGSVPAGTDFQVFADCWENSLTLRLLCCPSDL